MQRILFLFAAASFMFACDTTVGDLVDKFNNNETKETIVTEEVYKVESVAIGERSTTNNQLYYDLMQPTASGVFRGVHFDMSKDEVYDTESVRSTVDVYKDETDEELIVTTDMGKEILDFGDITYRFDEQGLYSIKVETYAITLEGSTEVCNMIIENYTEKYGAPTWAEDGYNEFTTTDEATGHEYSIAIKNIDDVEDSYGMYIYFDLL